MIINTGQRTDIPAFYSDWFINRIKEGYVMVRNPYYPSNVTRISLDPKVVDIIGFCTKNPRPMLKYLDILKPYGQFWYITITGFERDMEPNVPDYNQVIEDFKYLSNKIGKNCVGFRYTSIIINYKYTIKYHIDRFNDICSRLEGYTNLCAFGFIDIYPKLAKLHPELLDTTDDIKIEIAKEFKKIADSYNMELRLCSKEKWLKDYGINIEGCMLLKDYERTLGIELIPKKKMQARKGYCQCYLSSDIGAYSSCMHLCKYCYANGTITEVKENYNRHNPNSPFLIGDSKDTDIVSDMDQESWKDLRRTLF